MLRYDSDLSPLLAYWQHCRGAQIAPYRSAIDAKELGALQNRLFIIEQVQNGAPRFRVIGSDICDLYGMDLRGIPAHCLFDDSSCDAFDKVLRHTIGKPQMSHLGLCAPARDQKMHHVDMVLLPLLDIHKKRRWAIGAISKTADLSHRISAFSIEYIKAQSLKIALPRHEAALCEPEKPFGYQKAHPKARPSNALRVVK